MKCDVVAEQCTCECKIARQQHTATRTTMWLIVLFEAEFSSQCTEFRPLHNLLELHSKQSVTERVCQARRQGQPGLILNSSLHNCACHGSADKPGRAYICAPPEDAISVALAN